MALKWISNEKNVEKVKKLILELIAKESIPSAAKLHWEGDELHIRVEHGGKSEVRLAIRETKDGVEVVETKRELAFLHRAFVGVVEHAVDKVLSNVGFSKA